MTRQDKYLSFLELSAQEVEGKDYQVRVAPARSSDVAVLAPHGGKIEFLTSMLARSIAGDDHNFYAFEGIKPVNNADLHITSSRFDEPLALDLVASCRRVLTIHGLGGDELAILVGGRDEHLRMRIDATLCAAGFASKVMTGGPYGGIHHNNICNRGQSAAGVQIEVEFGLRRILHGDPTRYAAFVDAVREAIAG